MSFNPLEWIGAITGIFKDTGDIIKQAVTDKDMQNQILGNLKQIEMTISRDVYLAALKVETVPWVDALHKMSRPLLNFTTIVVVGILIWSGHVFTQWEVLLIGGPNTAYQIIKGKNAK